jgi:hypothetical protein
MDRMTGGEEPWLLFQRTGQVVLTKDYVEHDSAKTYKRGTAGLITHVRKDPVDEITHIDIRLPAGEFRRNVLSNTSRPRHRRR